MDNYKSYDYVIDILKMDFEEGFAMYKKGLDRIRKEQEENVKDKYWDLWKIESQQGTFKGSFDEYFTTKYLNKINEKDIVKDREQTEKELIEKFKDL